MSLKYGFQEEKITNIIFFRSFHKLVTQSNEKMDTKQELVMNRGERKREERNKRGIERTETGRKKRKRGIERERERNYIERER